MTWEIDLYVILDLGDTPTFFYNETIPSKAFALQRALIMWGDGDRATNT
ncbi:MAG: hypothetical protein R3B95_07360 [Nitrospirales bacterium]|nr:hypothetical protein [Nitrospirales bacterium]